MLHGLAAGETPPQLKAQESGVQQGRAPTSLLLTPKGRIVTEFQVARLANGDEGELLLHLPEAGLEEARAHLVKFLPPRFAKVTEPESPIGSFLLVGPDSPGLIARELFGSLVSADELSSLAEGEERSLPDPGPVGVRVVRRGVFAPLTFEVVADVVMLARIRGQLKNAGATEASDSETGELLRMEKGRPRFGVEMDRETLPPEAGVQDRSIDHRKGCYTGQEVIVRVRDRGHVNRHLRGVLLGEAPVPEEGSLLFLPGKDEAVGEVRSGARSPGFGQTIALAYLRREVAPPMEVRLGSPQGFRGEVRDLSDPGWVLVGGDSLLYP
jgi:folate-binding protein YgfZ